MNQRTRLWLLLTLALLGTAVGAYLAYIAWSPGLTAYCTGLGDCHRVQSSVYAKIAGDPIAALGLLMYAGLLTILTLRLIAPQVLPRPLAVWTFALALSGAGYSVYLTYLELFVIDAVCIWCVGSATIVSAICLLAVPDVQGNTTPPARRVGRRQLQGAGPVARSDV